jgi:hypothetical protein
MDLMKIGKAEFYEGPPRGYSVVPLDSSDAHLPNRRAYEVVPLDDPTPSK